MEQADYPSYTLDALRAGKETAAHRERTALLHPAGNANLPIGVVVSFGLLNLTNVTFQSQLARPFGSQAQ